jgi:tripartite-type tricarboxylate transporter receptor subunit TctC
MKRTIAALTLGLLTAVPAVAQDWPTKSVKLIVPFAAGATPDIVARLLADELQAKLGQPFVVENKPGASGNLGTDAVAKAEPDGYTLGISIGGPLAINTLLFSKLPYDPGKDLAFITMLATQPSALAVNTALKVDSVGELVALLKRNPGKYNFGSIGNGSLSHLAMEAIALKSGTQMVHVPYPSSPQAVTALMRGDLRHPATRLRSGQDPRHLDRRAGPAAARHPDPQGTGHRRPGGRLDGTDRAGPDACAGARADPEGVCGRNYGAGAP